MRMKRDGVAMSKNRAVELLEKLVRLEEERDRIRKQLAELLGIPLPTRQDKEETGPPPCGQVAERPAF